MLKPANAVAAIPNRETLLKSLEQYTDRILALEMSDEVPVTIIYNGEKYHQMKRYIRQFTALYSSYYDVQDRTNTRKFVYILEFIPVGS